MTGSAGALVPTRPAMADSKDAVPQLRGLRQVLRAIALAVHRGIHPVVEIDLDLCALRPVNRTVNALRRAGSRFGVEEFLRPETLPLLPGYSDEAWTAWVRGLRLDKRYRRIRWFAGERPVRGKGSVFRAFHDAYWNTALMATDEPTAGLGAFVHRVDRAGGRVVFLSGRWLPEQIHPSIAALRRAGIRSPRLVIGNPWHETLAGRGRKVLSDSQIKAYHQDEICRRHGTPVAIIDDRIRNRDAVASRVGGKILSVGIQVPGFSCDPASNEADWLLKTFEMFDQCLADDPVRPFLCARYCEPGQDARWHGLYEGLGRNNRPYAIPRRDVQARADTKPYQMIIRRFRPGSMKEPEFLQLCEQTIPGTELAKLEASIAEAELASRKGLASPFPRTSASRRSLRRSMIACWLHSRDVQVLSGALGYPVMATGTHDLCEYVDAKLVKSRVLGGMFAFPRWISRWATSLPSGKVNVAMLNPHLMVGMWQWTPSNETTTHAPRRGSVMDIHRLAPHHEGDGHEEYDPIEAAINNVLHRREGRAGIRKERVATWASLREDASVVDAAEVLAASSVGVGIVRDVIEQAIVLELQGSLTPWILTTKEPSSPKQSSSRDPRKGN